MGETREPGQDVETISPFSSIISSRNPLLADLRCTKPSSQIGECVTEYHLDGRPSFLIGGGQAADAIARIDWAATPLGPIGQWPQSLKTALSMMLLSSFPKAIAWGRELTTFHNDAFAPILGDKPQALGRPFSEVWVEVWPEIQPMVEKAFAGEATFIENFKLTIDRHGYPEEAYFTFCYSPIRAENGEVGGMMDTVMETTETVLAQRQLAVTNAELSHRMRNALAMVGAIATMSLRHATGLDEARRQLSQRLAALGRTQSFLSGEAAEDAHIYELIEQSFSAHPNLRQRIDVVGADFRLGSNQALALSLALNELITNSIKYGALSKPEGRIGIRWDCAGFRFVWREAGISGVEAPSREGFGSKVLMQFVPASFSGQARMRYESDGLIYELEAPAAAIDNT